LRAIFQVLRCVLVDAHSRELLPQGRERA